MTRPKSELALASRVRAYPDAEGCAAEFAISAGTWLRWVENGDAPPSIPGLSPPRWRWADVDDWISDPRTRDAIRARYAADRGGIAPAPGTPDAPDPYMRGYASRGHASKKGRGRDAAA